MSLITRCPACSTLFKVVPDQLRVSEGWVRCGQCDEVFDANAHLHSASGDVPVPGSSAPSASAFQPSPDPPATEATNGAFPVEAPNEEADVDTEPQMPVDPSPQLEQELSAKLEWPDAPSNHFDALMDVRPGEAFLPEPALHLDIPEQEQEQVAYGTPDIAPDASVSAEPTWEDAPTPVVPERVEPIDAAESTPAVVSAPVPLSSHAPTFMRSARKTSAWNKPWVRRSLVALAIVLLASLGLQVTLHERDRLAASVPDLRPALIALCDALQCQIAPFKRIDSVVIDASSFVKVRGDVYRLNLTLKNTALVDLAAPAVELTLTDTQDQPLLRRVLSANDLGAKQGTLVSGGELSAVVPLHVKTSGSAERISGYRLLAFYP